MTTSAMNPSTAMATTVCDELVRHGVAHVVVCPGSRSTALAIAAARTDGLRVHVRHDERSAAFLALGIGRGSGRPAAVVTTSGTAVANLLPAACEADAAGVPLVLLTADRPIELHDVGANQTLRQAPLLAAVARLTIDLPAADGQVGEPAVWRSMVSRLVAAAVGGTIGLVGQRGGAPAGPVHANIAFREPTIPGLDDGRTATTAYSQPVDGRPGAAPWTRWHHADSEPGPVVAALVPLLAGRRVLVVAGDAPGGIPGLDDLPWPVVAEPSAGVGLHAGIPHGNRILEAAAGAPGALSDLVPEVVLRLGRPTVSRAALVGLGDATTVQVAAAGLVDPARNVRHAVSCPPGDLVAALAGDDRVADDAAGAFAGTWRAAADRTRDVVDTLLGEAPASEPAVAGAVARATGQRSFVVASSNPVRDVATWNGRITTGRVHANRGLAGIDGFTSTAVGLALSSGPTVALAGDLSFLHDHNGLLVGDDRPDLTMVVVDNDGGGLFHHVPAVGTPEFDRLFMTPHGRDCAAIAAAAGAEVVRADAASLHEAATAAGPGLRVVVIRTNADASAAVRRNLAASVRSALTRR